jgi:hypothetical protein
MGTASVDRRIAGNSIERFVTLLAIFSNEGLIKKESPQETGGAVSVPGMERRLL